MKYTIGGIEFTQGKVSLRKLRQLVSILCTIALPKDLTTLTLVNAMGEKLPEMFSLILEGNYPKGKTIPGTDTVSTPSDFLDDNMDDSQVIQVIEDFLAHSPIYKKVVNLLSGNQNLSQTLKILDGAR